MTDLTAEVVNALGLEVPDCARVECAEVAVRVAVERCIAVLPYLHWTDRDAVVAALRALLPEETP